MKTPQLKFYKPIISSIITMVLLSNYLVSIGQNTYPNTMVIAHLDEKVDFNQNIIFASTFVSAWKSLKDDILGQDVILNEPSSLDFQLNKASEVITKNNDFVAMSGFVNDGIIDKINAILQSKFGIKNDQLKQFGDLADNIICYSYFDKNIRFKIPFFEHKKAYPFFFNKNRVEVECFGIDKDNNSTNAAQVRKQLESIDYIDCNNFILRMNGSDQNDELYLAKVPLGRTMLQTVQAVNQRIRDSKPVTLTNEAMVSIPKIKFSQVKSYDELLGKHLANKGFERYFFALADQNINFALNESGAKTQSEAVIVIKKGPNDNKFIFDRPFLLYIKKKGTDLPYFAMWIAHPEIMLTK